MKKHFILTSLFAFAFFAIAQTKTLASANLNTPGINFQKIHSVAEQQSGTFNHPGHDHGRDGHCNCDKCRSGKNPRRQGTCSQPGNHYGKHKNRGKSHGKGHNSHRDYRKNRDCGDNDRWSDRNRRDHRDHRDDRWGNDNQRDSRNGDNRRVSSTRRDRDTQSTGNSRSSKNKEVATREVKTSGPGTTRRVGSRPTVARN